MTGASPVGVIARLSARKRAVRMVTQICFVETHLKTTELEESAARLYEAKKAHISSPARMSTATLSTDKWMEIDNRFQDFLVTVFVGYLTSHLTSEMF